MYKSENQHMKAPAKVSSISMLHQFLGLKKTCESADQRI